MSLHAAAQHIAQKGRGRDKMLVHMSPREVEGLQALAKAKGGHLTTNPETGLPEAGFLEQLLPVVAAAAATYFTAGAAAPYLATAFGPTAGGILAGAGAGALIGGGSAAIQGGDAGQGALMGGLGGALGGAMGAFPTGAETATGTGLTAGSTGGAPGLTASPNAAVGASQQLTGAATVSPTTGGLIDPLSKTAGAVPPPASYIPSGSITAATPVSPTTASALETAQRSMALANQPVTLSGIGTPPVPSPTVSPNIAQTPADKGFWSSLSPMQKAGVSTAGAALTAEMARQPGLEGAPTDDYTSTLNRISPDFQGQEPIRPNPYYRSRYPTYAAGGGLMDAYQGGGPVERMSTMDRGMGMYPQGMIDKTQYAVPSQRPASMEVVQSDYDTGVNPITGMQPMARGGIADLGSYSDGGRMLKGPGDGMSDSIPGIIGNKQPARLADGEFVVPADVVSHLGNGSTDAGAKKLYAMMDRVRQARTGKKKQAPAVKTDKFIPRMA